MIDINQVRIDLQNHLTDGLLIIIGSGLSCAEGLPGMRELADHLQGVIPSRIPTEDNATWDSISSALSSGKGLEESLTENQLSQKLEDIIVEETAKLIIPRELAIIQKVISGKKVLRFSRLLTHLVMPNTGIPVITTNYDRLLEIAAEVNSIGVDTMFVGHSLGKFNISESKYSFCRGIRVRKMKQIQLKFAEKINLFKPHGSFDWYSNNYEPMKCPYELDLQRLIIAPGLNKFKIGYNSPFDAHRDSANKAIDNAKRYLVIGYGFNDDHLETHLKFQIKSGKPTLLISHGISQNAQNLLKESANLKAIVARKDKRSGFRYLTNSNDKSFDGANWWDLNEFVREVIEL